MTENDFEKFEEGLAGMYSFYDQQINQYALDIWWNSLKPFDLLAITQAFNRHVVNTESDKWLPGSRLVKKLMTNGLSLQKPVKLYEWILSNYAKSGQKIRLSYELRIKRDSC